MNVNGSCNMDQSQMQMQMRKMDGTGGGQGKGKGGGNGMQDVSESLSSDDLAIFQEQMSSMSKDDKMNIKEQVSQIDKSSMSLEDYAKAVMDIVNPSTPTTTNSVLPDYA